MLLQAVIEELVSKGIGVFGTDLFGSTYPQVAGDQAVCVRDNGGPKPSKELPIRTYSIQFLCRAEPGEFLLAYEKAMEIYYLFQATTAAGPRWDARHNYSIGSTTRYHVLSSEALQMPSDISPDDKGRAEVSFNILFKIRL